MTDQPEQPSGAAGGGCVDGGWVKPIEGRFSNAGMWSVLTPALPAPDSEEGRKLEGIRKAPWEEQAEYGQSVLNGALQKCSDLFVVRLWSMEWTPGMVPDDPGPAATVSVQGTQTAIEAFSAALRSMIGVANVGWSRDEDRDVGHLALDFVPRPERPYDRGLLEEALKAAEAGALGFERTEIEEGPALRVHNMDEETVPWDSAIVDSLIQLADGEAKSQGRTMVASRIVVAEQPVAG